MPQITHDYQYTIYGDVDIRCQLTLGLNCRVHGIKLESVELAAVYCHGVTFIPRTANKLTVVKSPDGKLPEHVKARYCELFREEYDDSQELRDKIFNEVVSKAVGAHYDMAYSA